MSVSAYTRIKLIASPAEIAQHDNVFQHYPKGNQRVYYFCKIDRGAAYKIEEQEGYLGTDGCSPDIPVGSFDSLAQARRIKVTWNFWIGKRSINNTPVNGRILSKTAGDKSAPDSRQGLAEWPHYHPDIFSKGFAKLIKPSGPNQVVVKLSSDCCKDKVPTIAPTPGSWAFYEQRHQNFIERHKQCGGINNPPDYYLLYGKKYCERFVVSTNPKLSQRGKEWMMETLRLLQKFMNAGICDLSVSNIPLGLNNMQDRINAYGKGKEGFLSGIECRNDDFRLFAFATHPDAYRPKKMALLSCNDLMAIAATPDTAEWHGFTDNTWSKAGDTWDQAATVVQTMGASGVVTALKSCAAEMLKRYPESAVTPGSVQDIQSACFEDVFK